MAEPACIINKFRIFMINKEKLLETVKTVHTLKLVNFNEKFPKAYFFIVILTALVGYGFLLLFPVMALIALTQFIEFVNLGLIENTLSFNSLSPGLIWFVFLLFGLTMTHRIFTIRFNPPGGVKLQPQQTPGLFEVIKDNKDHKFWPNIQNVLLSEQFKLEVNKTPVIGIPVWSRNSLVIGLPVMQSMPHQYFTIALTRKLVQYSKGRNIITNWLYQLRYIWSLYPEVFSQRNLLGDQIIVWFFRIYSSIYQKVSIYAAQQEELAADTLALNEINDSDLFKTIESQLLAQYFSQKMYMPKVKDLMVKKRVSPEKIHPFTNLPGVLNKTLNEPRAKQWLDMFENQHRNTKTTEPTLSQRMYNIGYTHIQLPELGGINAAQHFFGSRYNKVTKLMDKVWRNKITRRTMRSKNKPNPKTKAELQLNPVV